MNGTDNALSRLQISPAKKARRRSRLWVALGGSILVLVCGLAVFLVKGGDTLPLLAKAKSAENDAKNVPPPVVAPAPTKPGDVVLTVSGYVIPRQRIELSPKILGTVSFITVKKGDLVKKDQVIVQLEDDEYRARLLEAQGKLAQAEANLKNAGINLIRQEDLTKKNFEAQRTLDDARCALEVATAEVKACKGTVALAQTYLDWCTIRSPLNGTVLEKLVEPHELVMPQSFGNTRGARTALVALADLSDLQVEIDLNESDTPKVHLNQPCRVSPEAYPNKIYSGRVAEIAPEANRQKGTLQIKVQVDKPDRFLTPELSAKVDFIKE